jgi:hypothetical protein
MPRPIIDPELGETLRAQSARVGTLKGPTGFTFQFATSHASLLNLFPSRRLIRCRLPSTPTTSEQTSGECGRLLGLRLRSRSPPPLTCKSLTIQVTSTLAQFLPVPLLHLELRYDCTLLYVRPRRPCICLLGTSLCQCYDILRWAHSVPTTPMTGRPLWLQSVGKAI